MGGWSYSQGEVEFRSDRNRKWLNSTPPPHTVFQSRALNSVCQKTVQTTAGSAHSQPTGSTHSRPARLEEVHIRDVRPGEGLVRPRPQTLPPPQSE